MGLRKGDQVEFVTNYPGHEGELLRGVVLEVGDDRFPINPHVITGLGGHEVRDGDQRIKVVGHGTLDEGLEWAYHGTRKGAA